MRIDIGSNNDCHKLSAKFETVDPVTITTGVSKDGGEYSLYIETVDRAWVDMRFKKEELIFLRDTLNSILPPEDKLIPNIL